MGQIRFRTLPLDKLPPAWAALVIEIRELAVKSRFNSLDELAGVMYRRPATSERRDGKRISDWARGAQFPPHDDLGLLVRACDPGAAARVEALFQAAVAERSRPATPAPVTDHGIHVAGAAGQKVAVARVSAPGGIIAAARGLSRRKLIVGGVVALAPLAGITAALTRFGAATSTQSVAPIGGGIERILFGHDQGPVFAVAAAQLHGQVVVISGSADKTVKVWDPHTAKVMDPATGRQVPSWINGSAPVLAIATSTLKSGEQPVVISSGDDNSVQVWDLATGTSIYTLTGHSGPVRAITTVPREGRTIIISGSDDGTVLAWDLASSPPFKPRLLSRHTSGVSSVAAGQLQSRSGDVQDIVLSGSYDRTVQISNLTTGGPPIPSRPLPGPVYAVATEPLNGTVIITGGEENIVRSWDLDTGHNIGDRQLMAHSDPVRAITTTKLPSSAIVIISASNDTTLRVWDLGTAGPDGPPLIGHSGSVISATTTQIDGQLAIISGSDDATIRIWDLAARTKVS